MLILKLTESQVHEILNAIEYAIDGTMCNSEAIAMSELYDVVEGQFDA